MVGLKKCFAICFILMCAPAFAEDAKDQFQEVVAKYKTANPKPVLSEEAHKYKVQAEFMVEERQPDRAAQLYGKALAIAPWWAEGHFKLALLLGDAKKYNEATREMKRYLMLAPEGTDARAAQDRIYQWESVLVPEAGKTLKECTDCPELVEIPAGSFEMGSDKGEADEKPVHHVTIMKPFAIGRTEITQAQWRAVMGTEPSYFSGCGDDCPVEQVSWDDVQEYIGKLNARTGKQYRLPTEAEWEYACRAGGKQEYCGGDDANAVAWTNANSGKFFGTTPHPVARKQANAFGLYDMSGNVREWVADAYHDSYNGAPADGSAWSDGSLHVLRGGSWGRDPEFARATARYKFGTNFRDFSFGFRLARTLP